MGSGKHYEQVQRVIKVSKGLPEAQGFTIVCQYYDATLRRVRAL